MNHMKTCKDCGQLKLISDFRKKPSNRDGYELRCKTCRNTRYNKASAHNVFRKIYERQIVHSIIREHSAPEYTLEELKEWADQQPNIHDLWDAYGASNYLNELRPSVDRIDDSQPYTLDNIQLMTWNQNRQKGADAKKLGLVNANQKPVAAYNKDRSLHKSYVSIMDAVRDVNGSMWGVSSVANGVPVKDGRGQLYTPRTYKGFKWKWMSTIKAMTGTKPL